MNEIAAKLEAEPLRWINRRLGLLISAIDSEDFYPRLLALLRAIADCDSAVILLYRRDHAPVVLFEDLAPRDREALFGCYFEGAYLLSPFFLGWLEDRGSIGLYRLQDIVPEGFFASPYFTDYYPGSGLRDEIAYLVPTGPDTAVLLSLGRTENLDRYSAAELALLEALKSVVASCVEKHAALILVPERGRLHHQLTQRLAEFGAGILTDQERRVAQLLLRGHSSKSCARELDISPTTERVHRRNIYAKLKISSQAELFNRFFELLTLDSKRTRSRRPRSRRPRSRRP